MLRLMLLVVALVVIIALGAVGLVRFGVIPDFTGMITPMEARVEEPETPAPVAHPQVDPVFVDLPPFVVPVVRDREVQKNFTITLRLDVEPGQEEVVNRHMSKLQAAYLQMLYVVVPEQIHARVTLDVRALKQRLQGITDRIAGPGAVREVMVISVFDR
ncbi:MULTISPECIES: hypothetical protein [unclassified Haematospirillum]|uniref:hypothetical protein n=1 Tax=unclassified Haematospirillum TaxID=2622088 RepID=UPI00143C113D|nr:MULTISPECIES: hypothetical protein [unclassified Haematospirillum]NKD54247.1 hypothetical protein [Haematospirillum sp. H4890]NKD74292.1 hypothetical protein [Haematospirillum sp. H4485]NKD87039.1 hypothetical protein [Haematospirillum sp. 15-248]